jgi:Mg/Co/Ni transporter MgtE
MKQPSQETVQQHTMTIIHQYGAVDDTEADYLAPIGVAGRRRSINDDIESVFSSVRSESTEDLVKDLTDSDVYLKANAINRAFPERFIALTITLTLEIPVLFMISGGSDRLCIILGRSKYQLLLAFLPLTSAISGNCGLQCSTLTTRAISHSHVTSKTFLHWLRIELTSSLYLGVAMGTVIGVMAYVSANRDMTFGITIGTAQLLSILTAGLTGTLAPLIFTFVFHRDSGKWGGPLETAIQDIVGSFAMVILSYKMLLLFGAGDVSPSDTCGAAVV